MLASPSEIQTILRIWGLDPNYVLLRSSWHNILQTRRQGKVCYLRITPDFRTANEILAELEWMDSLTHAGVPVARILSNRSGEIIQSTELKSGPVNICCFGKAPGRLTQKRLDFRKPIIKSWAQLLFRLHEHAQSYVPKHHSARRRSWDEDPVLQVALSEAKLSLEPEAPIFIQWVEHFKELAPKNQLLLTHADLHFGNMTLMDESQVLTAFDFDDACYHYPEHDVAVALISIRKAAWEHPGLFDSQELEDIFIENYSRPVAALNSWCVYRIGMTYFWALGSAKKGAFDDERLTWLKNSTPWWKTQFQQYTASLAPT